MADQDAKPDFVQRARELIVQGNFAEAVKICRLGLLSSPTELRGRLVLGAALWELRRWDELLAEMRVALQIDPGSTDAWSFKAVAALEKGDFAQADAAVDRLAALAPADPRPAELREAVERARARNQFSAPADVTSTKMYPAKAMQTLEERTVAQQPTFSDLTDEESLPPSVASTPTGEIELGTSEVVFMPEPEPTPTIDSEPTSLPGDADEPVSDWMAMPDPTAPTNADVPNPLLRRQTARAKKRREEAVASGRTPTPPPTTAAVRTKKTPSPPRATARTAKRPKAAPRRNVLLIIASLIAVVSGGVAIGLVAREWRMRTRAANFEQLANEKLALGSYPGYKIAERLFKQILSERDDPRVRARRALVLGQTAFEFGEDLADANRAITAIASDTTQDAELARIYLQLAHGEFDAAKQNAVSALAREESAATQYALGRALAVVDSASVALGPLERAASGMSRNPLYQAALGAELTRLGNTELAEQAFSRALSVNPHHVTTLVERARLHAHRADGQEQARKELDEIINRFSGEASAGQLARAYAVRAELLLATGDVQAARGDLVSALAKRPLEDVLLSERLASLLMSAFELDQAEKEARRAAGTGGRIEPRLVLAEIALIRRQPAAALAMLDELGSGRVDAQILRARAHLSLEHPAEARAAADVALRADAENVDARVIKARADLMEGMVARATRDLEHLEQRGTKTADSAAALAQAYAAQRQPDRARTWLKEALRRDPLMVSARLELANVARGAGNLDEARAELNQILKIDAEYMPARRALAQIALDQGDATFARDEFDALVERDADIETLIGAARARAMLSDFEGAKERIARARGLGALGGLEEAVSALEARIALADHAPAEAIARLEPLLPSMRSPQTVMLLVYALLDARQIDRAFNVLKSAPQVTRAGVELTVARARAMLERGAASAAEAIASEALTRLKTMPNTQWLRAEALELGGRALYEQGSFRPALKMLEQATKLDPQNANAFYQLGLVQLELLRKEAASRSFEAVTRIDSKYAVGYYQLGRVRAELNDPRAKESWQAYLEIAPKGEYAPEVKRALADDGKKAPAPVAAPKKKRRR